MLDPAFRPYLVSMRYPAVQMRHRNKTIERSGWALPKEGAHLVEHSPATDGEHDPHSFKKAVPPGSTTFEKSHRLAASTAEQDHEHGDDTQKLER